jgi:hypothetical protein
LAAPSHYRNQSLNEPPNKRLQTDGASQLSLLQRGG